MVQITTHCSGDNWIESDNAGGAGGEGCGDGGVGVSISSSGCDGAGSVSGIIVCSLLHGE